MKTIKKSLARLLGCFNRYQYQMRCKGIDHYPGCVSSADSERCGKWV
jgi:hypothetical protein